MCIHSSRQKIDAALVANDSYRDIAGRFNLSRTALLRHKADHIPLRLLRAREARELADADGIMAELKRCMERVNLLYDACDRWLRDPDDDSRYDVGPRAEDVNVIYVEVADGRSQRRKAKLSLLLARLEDAGVQVDRGEVRHADPRELVLKTHAQLSSSLELLAKLAGELDERPIINVLTAPEWLQVRGLLLEALRPFPDARAAVAARLMAVEAA